MKQLNEKELREGFNQQFVHPTRERNFNKSGKILCSSEGDEIADYWLSILKEREQNLREEILKLTGYLPSNGYFTDLPEGEILVAKSDVLALLSNNQN